MNKLRDTSGELVFGPWSLAHMLGINNSITMTGDDIERKTAKAVYKHTLSGVGLSFNDDGEGITIYGYVELHGIGEVAAHSLTFPFTEEDFWEAVEIADYCASMVFDGAYESDLDIPDYSDDVIDDDDAQRSADVNEVLR